MSVKKEAKEKAGKIIHTFMVNSYISKFILRLLIFAGVLLLYLFRRDMLVGFMTHEFTFGVSEYGISPLHILWFIFVVMMIRHLAPDEVASMALRKSKVENYSENEGYSQLELLKFVQDMNVKAWTVLLVWVLFNSVFAALYLLHIIGEVEILMLTMFYFVSDYICILFFCPFQTYIMKNKCCINCRIYDWGHFMMFTPLLLIQNFFSWSLFFLSVVVLIKWEIIYARHPERFWEGSNKTLQCANCQDKTCQIKKKIAGRKE